MIGIIGAMAEEVAAVRDFLGNEQMTEVAGVTFYQGQIDGVPVVVAQSGIGKVNAAMSTTLLCQLFNPTSIINTGSAGGFHAHQSVGDLIVSLEVIHHDVDVTAFGYLLGQVPGMPATFAAEQKLIDIAHDSIAEMEIKAHKGQVASGDKFMTKPHHIEQTRIDFPEVHAVEMEAAAIAQVCHRFNVPFVVVRALSDIAGTESPMSFEQFLPLAAANAAQLIRLMLPRVVAAQLG